MICKCLIISLKPICYWSSNTAFLWFNQANLPVDCSAYYTIVSLTRAKTVDSILHPRNRVGWKVARL